MNVKVQNRNLPVKGQLQDLIDKRARKVRKLLPTFHSQDLELHVTLEQLPRGRQFHTSLVLNLPQRVIRVDDVEENIVTSVLRAFDELVRRVKRFKSHLNREKFWQREREAVPEETAGATRVIEDAAHANLDKIENFIRREVYHRAISQGTRPGDIEINALVDEVFLQMTSHAGAQPENLSIEQWMYQIARRVVRQQLQEIKVSGEQSHVEEQADVSTQWEDEDLNFFQPDESLRLEDVLSDTRISTPEEYMESEETERELQNAIAHLPDPIRETFVLFALEGFNADEVAMVLGKTPREVLEAVDEAREILSKEVRA